MDSRGKIKDRILRRAARVWGYSDKELETSFDPMVKLLLDALSFELDKINIELNASRDRIVDRFLEVLFADSNLNALSAHGIMHSIPSENNFKISQRHQFITKKITPNIYDPATPIEQVIHFGPVSEMCMTTASVKYLCYNQEMIEVNKVMHKQSKFDLNNHLGKNVFLMGLNSTKPIELIENLTLYTDCLNIHQKVSYLYFLKQSTFLINNVNIDVVNTFSSNENYVDIKEHTSKHYNNMNFLEDEIKEFYSNHFLSFQKEIVFKEDIYTIPEDLLNVINEEQINEIKKEKIVWIQIIFPEEMPHSIIENIIFATNCFPVVNKKLNHVTKKTRPFVNYIPLEAGDDLFISVDEVSDSKGYRYELNDFRSSQLKDGKAVVRNQGVSRFNDRDASTQIHYLVELLKDESASFSIIGNDFVDETLRKLNQLIATLEEQLKEKNSIKSSNPYLIIRPIEDYESNEFIDVYFWSGSGVNANNLRPLTSFQLSKGAEFIDNSIYLVNSTVGGRETLTKKEKVIKLNESLLSRGRIVTKRDVMIFAKSHFRQTIVDLYSTKGTRPKNGRNQGLERTTDIIITRKIEEDQNSIQRDLSESQWNFLCSNFLHKLEKRSSNVYPFRLFEKLSDGKITEILVG